MKKLIAISTLFLSSVFLFSCEDIKETTSNSKEKTLSDEEKLELQWQDFIVAIQSGDKSNLESFLSIKEEYGKENWEDVTLNEPEFYEQLKTLNFSDLTIDDFNPNQKTALIYFESFYEGVKYESSVVFYFEVIEGKIKIVNIELYG